MCVFFGHALSFSQPGCCVTTIGGGGNVGGTVTGVGSGMGHPARDAPGPLLSGRASAKLTKLEKTATKHGHKISVRSTITDKHGFMTGDHTQLDLHLVHVMTRFPWPSDSPSLYTGQQR